MGAVTQFSSAAEALLRFGNDLGVERFVDTVQRHGVSHEWGELDFAFHRIFDHLRKLAATFYAAKC